MTRSPDESGSEDAPPKSVGSVGLDPRFGSEIWNRFKTYTSMDRSSFSEISTAATNRLLSAIQSFNDVVAAAGDGGTEMAELLSPKVPCDALWSVHLPA